jgi:hypothetical protein
VARRSYGAHPEPVLTGLADGGYAVAWSAKRRSGTELRARLFRAKGKRRGEAIRVTRRGALDPGASALVALEGGGLAITWAAHDRDGSGFGIYSRRIDKAGKPTGSAFRINTTTEQHQWQPGLSRLADGDVIAVWTSQDQDGSREGVFGKRIAAGSR